MKRISPLISTLLTSLLVLLVIGQGVASSLVLCVGADGHAAYEQAFAGKCTPIVPACPATEECSCAACADDHCGPCHDIATSPDPLHGRSRGDREFAAPLPVPLLATAAVSPAVPSFTRDLTANLSSQPPPQPYTALTALRSVILLN